ncbi:MAG: TolC family protein, partial [Acidobacteriota bacterium]
AAQTRADLQSRGIEMVELERSIRDNVTTAAGALGITSAAIDRAEETVKYDADVLEGTMRRFEVGELTLFDTLRTEEQVTTDKLELIRLQQTYLGILVRLRFEMGDLVRTVGGTAAATEELVFEPAGIVIK